MKLLPLSKGKTAIVDDDDYADVAKLKWTALECESGIWYARRSYREGGKKIYVPLHRYIMKPPPDKMVDHRDGDGLNCQRYNMRICTHQQNMFNRKPTGSSSKYKGVSWDRCAKRWQAKIKIDGVQIKIGYFSDEVEAAIAYDKQALFFFGNFAWLNFPNTQTAA